MAYVTPHYSLVAFTAGDEFSAALDKQTFVIIDNEMYFMSEQMGDGVINGWTVTAGEGPNINVSSGIGMIQGEVTLTYGSETAILANNARAYVYMQKRAGITGQFGAFSPVGTVVYTDTTPPANPATPTVETNTYPTLTLTWDANTEPDFASYTIYRDGTSIGTSVTNSFTDETISPNVTYTYTLTATDVNANTSGHSGILSVLTAQNAVTPSDPSNVSAIIGNGRIEVLWDAAIGAIGSYQVNVQELNGSNLPVGSPTILYLSSATTYVVVNNLANGSRYSFTVYSVSLSGVLSRGIIVYGMPSDSVGPDGIVDLQVTDYALDSSGNVAITVTWNYEVQEYLIPPAYYFITIAAAGQTGIQSIYTTTAATIAQYSTLNSAGNTVTNKIVESTEYTILVQGVDEDGNAEPGTSIRFTTNKFTIPASPTNLVLNGSWSTTTAFLQSTWTNSASSFSYNLLTVVRTSLNGGGNTTIASSVNIGTATSYSVPLSYLMNNSQYNFTIIAVDYAGNQSIPLQGATVFSVATGGAGNSGSGLVLADASDRPGVPAQQQALGEDFRIVVNWSLYPSDFLASYNVWRALYKQSDFVAADWSKVAVLNSETYKWTDYSVQNGQSYVYFITVTDIFGNESLNPNDGYYDYSLSYATPVSFTDLLQSPAVFVSNDGYNANLTWDQDNDSFDGFEIYRAEGEPFTFTKIGDAPPNAISFTDNNALLLNGNYYYMTREYLNEADIVVTYSNTIVPAGCVLIATVVVVDNEVYSIDDTVRTNLANLIDPITADTHAQLILPHHPYVSASDDRRIRIGTNWIVTDWTTSDYINYTTTVNMLDTNDFQYIVYINGVQSTVQSSLDAVDGILTFESAIFDNTSSATPPTISVIFEGLNDVTGTLPASYLSPLSAVKLTEGILTSEQIPQYNHLGRYQETLYPFQTNLTYTDGYNYTSSISGTTFYDVIRLSDGRLLCATSAGVIVNDVTGGTLWTTLLAPSSPTTKLHYSSAYGYYFALAGSLVYYSSDLVNFLPIDGMQGVNIVRDITEDNIGNIYATTDAGVQLLNPTEIVTLIWLQTTLPNVQDTNTYAIFFNANNNTLYVSCSDGLYSSTDHGNSWQLADLNVNAPLFSIIMDGTTMFACSNTNIWRKRISDSAFAIIFTSVDKLRKLTYFGGLLYVLSNQTLLNNDSAYDIINASYVPFVVGFAELNINGILLPINCLTISSGYLFVGMDNTLYSTDITRYLQLNAEINGVTPTIFSSDLVQNVGVYYSSSEVFFDEQLTPLDTVSIVTSYQSLYTAIGGWADLQYNADVFVHVDGVLYAVGSPTTDAQTISAAVSAMQLTAFNGRNSNYDTANATLTSIVQLANSIDQLAPTAVVPASTITQLLNLIEVLQANVDPSLQSNFSLPPIGGTLEQIPATLSSQTIWQFNTDPSTLVNSVGTFDAIAGNVSIQTLTLNRYSLVQLSIKGVGIVNTGVNTHQELDDIFESVNSGLPASFSFVQAGNVARLGLLLDALNINIPGWHTFTAPQWYAFIGQQWKVASAQEQTPTGTQTLQSYQASYNLPINAGWYDEFNSTVDYLLQIEQDASGLHLFYPADVLDLYDQGVLAEIWVCGNGVIIGININTFQTRKVYSSQFYIYNMDYANNVVNFLAEDGLYTIDPSTNIVSKKVSDVPLPDNYTSVYFINTTQFIATNTGLLSIGPYDPQYTNLLTINNAIVRGDSSFSFCVGQDPLVPANGQVYYSTGGGSNWNRSTDFPSLTINSVCQFGSSVYYATNGGLYVQNLSDLFSSAGSSLQLVDLANDLDVSATIQVNDVTADNIRVIAGDASGNFYQIEGGVITSSQTLLTSIHKVKLVNEQYWLFGFDLTICENASTVIQIATGKIAT